MSEKILVPELGESITEATVAKWLKKKGENINADEPVVELETYKVNLEVLLELKKILKITNVVSINQSGALKNKTFMLTGKLQGMSRAEAKSLIEQNSGKIISNVNKKLDYLIIGEKPTMKKVNNAKELNIKVITQDEWIKMLNMAS